jgi:SprT-like family
MQTPLTTREAWLTQITEKYLWPRIEAVGGHRPQKYRVGVGFPKGRRGSKGHSIGQCWSQEVSADQTCEIFISPELDAAQAVAVLCHEGCHAAVGVRHGHRAPFKGLALAIGLSGPMRATVPTPDFEATIQEWVAGEPAYPHAPLTAATSPTKPGSRLLKARCEACGYTVRVTRQWLDIASPLCPDLHCDAYLEPLVSAPSEVFKRHDAQRAPEPRHQGSCCARPSDRPVQ